MANPLDFLKTTNYPNALLENTFGNQYFKDVVNPAKTGIGAKPPLGQLIKNWNPIKAFSPNMLKTGPTTGGMIGAGITAGLIGGQIGDWAYKNWEPATEFGDWAGGGIYDLIHGPQQKFRQDQFMNTQKQTMQERIQKAEMEQKRKEAAAAQAAAAQQVRQNIQTYGNRDRPDRGMNAPGGGKGQSPTGGNVSGTPFARGGLIDLYRYGGFI